VLNNIEVSCEYILKLKGNLEAEESNIFTDLVEKVQLVHLAMELPGQQHIYKLSRFCLCAFASNRKR
jgi:hypothetical protein